MSNFVELKFKDQTLRINPRGGGIAEYFVHPTSPGRIGGPRGASRKSEPAERHDIIYGYAKEEDCDGSMGNVLAPFPGRVENGSYDFQEKHYQLKGFLKNKENTIHAFAREMQWQVNKTAENTILAVLEIQANQLGDQGYPFGLKFQIVYTLSDEGLEVATTVENTGQQAAPFGIGYHPYFKVATEVDEMVWRVPAKKVVEFDETLKPTGKLLDIGRTNLDFRKARAIEGIEIDNCFTDLIRDDEGIFSSKLSNLTGTKEIEIWQDESYPYFQTYSADTISERNYRKAMALEPQTCCGYAVNVPDLGLISLNPGQKFEGKWGVKHKFK